MGTARQALILLGITAVLTVAAALFHPKRPPWRLVDGRAASDILQMTEAQVAELPQPVTVITTDREMAGDLTLTLKNWEQDLFAAFESLQAESSGSILVIGGDREAVAERLRELLGLESVYTSSR